MIRRLILFLLCLLLGCSAALADPLRLVEDYTGSLTVLYDEKNPDSGHYICSYAYPHADPEDPDAVGVNSYYEERIREMVEFSVPNLSEYYQETGQTVDLLISYEITCNKDDFFSVLLCQREVVDGDAAETWKSQTFSFAAGMADLTFNLPRLLGTLSAVEYDSWLENRQTGKANEAVRTLVWEQIQEDKSGEYFDFLNEETLEYAFNPEEDFYLDETGSPVFFINPGRIAPPERGLLRFPLSVEDILDEM